jgi:hypothetical protein
MRARDGSRSLNPFARPHFPNTMSHISSTTQNTTMSTFEPALRVLTPSVALVDCER